MSSAEVKAKRRGSLIGAPALGCCRHSGIHGWMELSLVPLLHAEVRCWLEHQVGLISLSNDPK